MIRIKVRVGEDARKRERDLRKAVELHARVWKVVEPRDRSTTAFVHQARNVKGRVRTIKSDDPECLVFSCTARSHAEEAITAGRFVHLVLRDLDAVSEITLRRR